MVIRAKFNSRCPSCGQFISAGEEIEWERGKKATHVECPSTPKTADHDGPTYKIHGGSGYGCHGWTEGQVIAHNREGDPAFLFVLSATSRYFEEDGLSFGVGDDRGRIYYATCREATEEESAPLRAKIAEVQRKRAAQAELSKLAAHVRETGEQPPKWQSPEGEILFDTQTIYGGGDWWVVGSEEIWYVQNNGGDGDCWAVNNVRTGGAGAIGWRITRTEEMVNTLEDIKERFGGMIVKP